MAPDSHILVVEDDPDMADVVLMVLKEQGYEVTNVQNGREALDAVARQMPGLILLDMMMPVMDGWQFAHEFHRRYGTMVPIVVVTAGEQPEKRAREVGASAWLPKPFELRVLLHTIARLYRPAAPARIGLAPGGMS